jgi:hypothetical protein
MCKQTINNRENKPMFGMNESCAVQQVPGAAAMAGRVRGASVLEPEMRDTAPGSLVETIVVHLRGRVGFLHELQSLTESRLVNVLQPVPGANGATEKATTGNDCALANELADIARGIEALIARKQQMLDRVQV